EGREQDRGADARGSVARSPPLRAAKAAHPSPDSISAAWSERGKVVTSRREHAERIVGVGCEQTGAHIERAVAHARHQCEPELAVAVAHRAVWRVDARVRERDAELAGDVQLAERIAVADVG